MNTKAHGDTAQASHDANGQTDTPMSQASRIKRRLFVGLHGLLIALTMGLTASQGYAGHLQDCTKSWEGNWSCVFNYLLAQSEPATEATHSLTNAASKPMAKASRMDSTRLPKV